MLTNDLIDSMNDTLNHEEITLVTTNNRRAVEVLVPASIIFVI